MIPPPSEIVHAHDSTEIETTQTQVLPLPCPACGCPKSASSNFCIACGLPFDAPIFPAESKSIAAETLDSSKPASITDSINVFHCENCGSDIEVQAGQLAYRCPFCDTNYVAKPLKTSADRRSPEFIIGFAITPAQAMEKYAAWIAQGHWFRPGDLSLKAMSDKQAAIYIPFWHYAYAAASRWNANIGQFWYRTETYTVTDKDGKTQIRTRQVRETEWQTLAGAHQKYYFGYLVSASKGLTHKESLTIQPYDLRGLKRFQNYFLAGWISEPYAIDYQTARKIAEEEFQQQENSSIAAILPGDTSGGLQVQTQFELNEIDLTLLPVHILSYRYHDKVYRFLVNGQTGKFAGEKPLSTTRIAVAIIAGLILIAIVVVSIMLLQGAN